MGEDSLLVGGWREVSLVDVLEHVSFTLWLALCNLRCPWCSNARLARGVGAKPVSVERLVEVVKGSSAFVEVFHVTGGEPLIQFRQLRALLERVRGEVGLPLSLDTNGTLPERLKELAPLLYHVAIDVKAPLSNPALYALAAGISREAAEAVVESVRRSIEAALSVPFLELRTTLVPGLLTGRDVVEVARSLEEYAERARGRVVFVVQQFIPYEGVEGEFARRPAAPPEEVRRAASLVAEGTRMEVYYRTIEEGARKLARRAAVQGRG